MSLTLQGLPYLVKPPACHTIARNACQHLIQEWHRNHQVLYTVEEDSLSSLNL